MSHTLHRVAGIDGLSDDYVILVMASVSYNKDASTPGKYKEHLRIMLKHNPVNLGGMGIGHLLDSTPEEIIGRIDQVFPNLPMVHGVFKTREDLIGALREIAEAKLGLSIIVSGLVDSTKCCAKEAGVARHSANYSFGIWGDTSLLPDERIMQISSMCGHAMISFNLVQQTIEDIRAGRITAAKAAAELAKPCVCGIFNAARAQRLLEEFL